MYKLEKITISYVDRTGSFDKIPKRGVFIRTEFGKLRIIDVKRYCRYSDNGKHPFEVHLTCRT